MFFFLQLVILFHRALMISRHPLLIGLILILTRIIYGVIRYFMVITAWVPYILVIVFVSGAIIIFIYIASLSSNENIKIRLVKIASIIVLSETIIIYVIKAKPLGNSLDFTPKENLQPTESTVTIYKTYNIIIIDLTIIIVSYLLVVLIVAIKIISFNKGPLRT